MPTPLATLLRDAVNSELPHLRALTETAASAKPSGPDSWSPKEELGHLIDSAANNHIRFVLASIQPEMRGAPYAQNAWVDTHNYAAMPWLNIVNFWQSYNLFLADLIARIPPEKLTTNCFIGDAEPVTLAYLIEDYVMHLKHHADHMLQRENITVYPSQKR